MLHHTYLRLAAELLGPEPFLRIGQSIAHMCGGAKLHMLLCFLVGQNI